jgi:hypothetical protein
MVAATDFTTQMGAARADGTPTDRPKRRRFRLLASLAAPFKDVDERAIKKKGANGAVRNNSKGNMFAAGVATPEKVPVKRFSRSGD